jgi:hypothetical protein
MQDLAQLALFVFQLYLALGFVCIGFGFMVLGKNGGRRAAQFYVGGSLRWAWLRLTRVLRALSALLWFWSLLSVRWIGRALLTGLRASIARR